jgi:hypothetical protein
VVFANLFRRQNIVKLMALPAKKPARCAVVAMGVLFLWAIACTPQAPLRNGPSYAPSYESQADVSRAVEATLQKDPVYDLSSLLGLSGQEVESLLGTASLKRHEPPAQVWQYPEVECVLHVFLYEEDGAYRVQHYEARFREGYDDATEACLSSLVSDHKEPPDR